MMLRTAHFQPQELIRNMGTSTQSSDGMAKRNSEVERNNKNQNKWLA